MSGEEADQLQQRALAGAHEIIDSSTSPSRGAVDDAGLAILLLILRNFGRVYEADKATAESFMAKLMEGFGEQHRECDVIFCKSGNWQLCSKTNTVVGCCRAHLPKHGFHTAFPAECVGDETPAVHSGFA